MQRAHEVQGKPLEELQKYGASIKASLTNKSEEELQIWSEKQAYIALNSLIIACAQKQIDACPMEGFNKAAYTKLLGLESLGLQATVIATVGYRSPSDPAQYRKKVRLGSESLFQHL